MFHFLSISNLNTSKGTFVLLDAAKLLLKRATDFHVHFVGAPTAEISTECMYQEIAKRGLQDVVTYHGKQYGEDKEQRFAEADCFVHPTLDDCFPLVILEAMQHALPVIATPVGAIPDMVMEGETGKLVPVQNAEVLAETMMKMMSDTEFAKQLGNLGRGRYSREFVFSTFEGKILTLLHEE